MTGVSKLDRHLAKDLREHIFRMFELGYTVTEVTDYLNAMQSELEVKRSAIGLKRKHWADLTKRQAIRRELVEAHYKAIADEPESMIAVVNADLIQGLILDYIAASERAAIEGDENYTPPKPSELLALATAVQRLNGARKTSVDTTITVVDAVKTAYKEEKSQISTGNKLAVEFIRPAQKVKSAKAKKVAVKKAAKPSKATKKATKKEAKQE